MRIEELEFKCEQKLLNFLVPIMYLNVIFVPIDAQKLSIDAF